MRIFNRTNEDIIVNGWIIPPENFKESYENIFDTVNIHADFGSAIITCEYKDRIIRCFGNLDVHRRPHEHDIRLDEYDVVKKGDQNG